MKKTKEKKHITITSDVKMATYVNFLEVSNNEGEFNLILCHIDEMRATGEVVSRIIVTPKVFEEMIVAMDENLEKYKRKYLKKDK